MPLRRTATVLAILLAAGAAACIPEGGGSGPGSSSSTSSSTSSTTTTAAPCGGADEPFLTSLAVTADSGQDVTGCLGAADDSDTYLLDGPRTGGQLRVTCFAEPGIAGIFVPGAVPNGLVDPCDLDGEAFLVNAPIDVTVSAGPEAQPGDTYRLVVRFQSFDEP
jgi:hypothetical protein